MSRYHHIDLQNPINWQHSLNVSRLAWWFTPPDSGWGSGYILRDLCRRFDGTITTGGSAIPQWAVMPTGDRCLNWATGGSTDGYVDVGGATALDLTNNFTVGCSFVASSLTTLDVNGLMGLVNKYNSGGANEWFLRLHDTNGLGTLTYVEFGGNSAIVTTVPLVANTLYRVIGVMRNGTAIIYVNGTSLASGAMTITSGSDNVLIGDAYLPNQSRFSGRISDAFVSKRAWSDGDVALDYQLSRRGYRVENSPLRWLDSRQIFSADGSGPVIFADVAYGTDLYQEPGIRVFADSSRIYGDATGFGPIANDGIQYFADGGVGRDAFAGEVPTLVAFYDTGVGSDEFFDYSPVIFEDIGRASENFTNIVNGNRKIVATGLYRR